MTKTKAPGARRRPAPGGMRFTSWLALVVGIAISAALLEMLGLPSWVSWPMLFLLLYVMLFREMRSTLGVGVDDGELQCARCDANPRTATGFCVACSAALDLSPLPTSHPAHPVIHALERGDFKAAAPRLAHKVTMHMANGRTAKMSRRTWLLNARSGQWAYPDRTGTILALHLDPANADDVWVRTHDDSEGRLLVPRLDLTVVARYRMPHEEIVEIQVYPALPKSGAAA